MLIHGKSRWIYGTYTESAFAERYTNNNNNDNNNDDSNNNDTDNDKTVTHNSNHWKTSGLHINVYRTDKKTTC